MVINFRSDTDNNYNIDTTTIKTANKFNKLPQQRQTMQERIEKSTELMKLPEKEQKDEKQKARLEMK